MERVIIEDRSEERTAACGFARRSFLAGACGLALVPRMIGCRAGRAAPGAAGAGAEVFRAIERRVGGRLGVLALDTGRGAVAAYRADERFALCSTFKLVLAAVVLARVDAGQEDLARPVPYDTAALLAYAPVARAHVGAGALRVAALCEAAVTVSDNTAANLLLGTLGGPTGLTRYFRALGDTVSRLDRDEPTLNEARPGDARDTTTPRAMAHTAARVLVGDALRAASRARLVQWLEACTTGRARLRAGLPRGWRAGDKTGTGEPGTSCDVAIAWPPGRAPWLIAAYLTDSPGAVDARNAALAQVATVVTTQRG
jgi:beta-lactamase class A